MINFFLLLTPEIRKKLKAPIGRLIRGSSDQTMKTLKKLVEEKNPPRIISVGDTVSHNMMKYGVYPHILIIDNKVMRKPIKPLPIEADKNLYLKNPPGTLTGEAWLVLREALKQEQRTKILVKGEEDLLTLVAIMCAPKNSFVVYGQPYQGIVVVEVTEEKKEMMDQIVEAMKCSSKS